MIPGSISQTNALFQSNEYRRVVEASTSETRSNLSIEDLGESLTDRMLSISPRVLQATVEFLMTKAILPIGANRCSFKALKSSSSRNADSQAAHHDFRQWESHWQIRTPNEYVMEETPAQRCMLLNLETFSKTPLASPTPRALEPKCGLPAVNPQWPSSDSASKSSKSNATISRVFRIHEKLAEYASSVSQSSTLETHTMHLVYNAFKLADEDFLCSRLDEVRVRLGIGLKVATVRLQRSEYEQAQRDLQKSANSPDLHRAYIALGSNVGNKAGMIESACQQMGHRNIRIIRTSALYETEPMYFLDQRSFLNGVCEVSTQDAFGRRVLLWKEPCSD